MYAISTLLFLVAGKASRIPKVTCYFSSIVEVIISNTSDSVSSGYPNTEKRVENTRRSGVFLTKFEVFG